MVSNARKLPQKEPDISSSGVPTYLLGTIAAAIRKLVRRNILSVFTLELPLYLVGLLAGAILVLLTLVCLRISLQVGMLPDFTAPVTFSNYAEVLFDTATLKVAWNTLIVGVGTTAIAFFFAVPSAWLLQRTDIPWKRFFMVLMFLQLIMPAFLRAMGYIMLLSPKIGMINQFLRLFIPVESGPLSPYNLFTISFLQGLGLTPVLFLMISGAFWSMDSTYEEAASACGAGRLVVFRRITMSFVKPALTAGLIYIFMLGLSLFETAALLGTPKRIYIFPTLMYQSLYPDFGSPNFGIAAVYGTQLIIPLLVILYFYQKVLKSAHRYAAVTGKGYKPKWVVLGRLKWVGLGFIGLYFMLVFFLPFLTMLWASFVPYFQLPSMEIIKQLSLNAYKAGFSIIWNKQALTNTLLLMFFVGLFTVGVSFAISWIVIRGRLPGKYALDSVAMLPQALPRAALAIVVLYVALSVVKIVPIYGTVIILIIANTITYIPFTTRTITSAFIQIHRELEEAAQVAGGSVWVTIRRIVVPVILPALIFAFIWTALLAYREVTMALFLIGPKNIVLASEIWTLWDQSDIVTAAAIGVIMVLIGGIILFGVMSLFPRVFRERIEI